MQSGAPAAWSAPAVLELRVRVKATLGEAPHDATINAQRLAALPDGSECMPIQQAGLAVIEAVLLPLHDVYVYPDAPSHPEALQLLAYWLECMAGGGFIMGKHIPSRRIGPLLRNIIIHEPLADGSDLVVRLAGSAVRRRHDWDIKGALLSSMFAQDVFRHHLESSLTAIRTGAPVIIDARMMRGDIEVQHYEALLLPVTASDLTTKWMLAALFFFD